MSSDRQTPDVGGSTTGSSGHPAKKARAHHETLPPPLEGSPICPLKWFDKMEEGGSMGEVGQDKTRGKWDNRGLLKMVEGFLRFRDGLGQVAHVTTPRQV